MRTFWDQAARTNAMWYVDTSLDFDSPDIDTFFETGRKIVDEAVAGAPKPVEGELAVEIGSGLGRVCRALSPRFHRVVGFDISPEMVERARKLVAEANIEFVVGDGATLAPLADASADLVLSFTVFQHIPDVAVIERYIAESGRVLKPGGLFVFQWNNIPGSWRWIATRRARALAQRTGLKPETHGRNAEEFLGSRVPLRRIERALTGAGMRLLSTKGSDTLFAWAWAQREGTR
jgi:SAM-dependent methyltransferase